MGETLAKIVAALASPKVPITSVALIIAGIIAIQAAPPDRLHTAVVAGSIGFSLLVAYLFFRFGIHEIPARQRSVVTIVVLVLLIILMSIQARAAIQLSIDLLTHLQEAKELPKPVRTAQPEWVSPIPKVPRAQPSEELPSAPPERPPAELPRAQQSDNPASQELSKKTPSTSSGKVASGIVRDGNTRRPIDSAMITFRFGSFSHSVHTNSEGIYRFPLPSGAHGSTGRIIAEKDGYIVYDRHIEIFSYFEEIHLIPTSKQSTPVSLQKRANYSFGLQYCRKNEGSIYCSVMVRNNGRRNRLYVWGTSRILDNMHNENLISRVFLGVSGNLINRYSNIFIDIPAGDVMQMYLTFDDVDPSANSIEILEIDSRGEVGIIAFNNIPLSN